MLVKFWGVRGSMAKPGPTTLQYGGNTSCVEVRSLDGTLVVLDCGTGAHGLGQALLSAGVRPLRGHLLISHTHWDHIQGIPFFVPLFVKGNEWDVYAPAGLSNKLESTLAGQMEYEYFPVKLGAMGATIRFHDLAEGTFQVGGIKITGQYMNHPGMSMGYRLEADGGTLVYATDHEPHSRHHLRAGDSLSDDAASVHAQDDAHVRFLSGADVVIHDAQYTKDEYPAKIGWGHSPAERVVDWCMQARVKRLMLYHHDPLRDDRSLTALVHRLRRQVGQDGGNLDVGAAAEGESIDVSLVSASAGALAGQQRSDSAPPIAPVVDRIPVLVIADDDPDMIEAIVGTLRPQGLTIHVCHNGREAVEKAREVRPDLMILDWQMPVMAGIDACRALRGGSDPALRAVPILFLTSMVSADYTTDAFDAGATDFLTKPFSPSTLRSKVQQWLIRSRSR